MGDGTTSVVVLAGEILKEVKDHVEQGVSSQTIIKGLRRASTMAVNKVKEIAVNTNDGNKRETLSKLAGTAMSSKLIKRNTGFFTKSMFSCLWIWGGTNVSQWLLMRFFLSTKMISTRNSSESRRSPVVH